MGPLLASGLAEVERQVAADVPDGKRAALVFVATPQGGQFVAAAKIGHGWQVEARAGVDWAHVRDTNAEVRIVGSW